jgi:hypothetical protein
MCLMVIRRFVVLVVLTLGVPAFAHAQSAQQGPTPPGATAVVLPIERSDAAKLVQHSHTTGATLTLSAGAANSNTQSIYIDEIDISNCQGSAVTPAAPTFITTTGINGNPQYMIGSGPATAGACSPTAVVNFVSPLKSATPGTNVTFVLPAFITNQTISVNVAYHLGY